MLRHFGTMLPATGTASAQELEAHSAGILGTRTPCCCCQQPCQSSLQAQVVLVDTAPSGSVCCRHSCSTTQQIQSHLFPPCTTQQTELPLCATLFSRNIQITARLGCFLYNTFYCAGVSPGAMSNNTLTPSKGEWIDRHNTDVGPTMAANMKQLCNVTCQALHNGSTEQVVHLAQPYSHLPCQLQQYGCTMSWCMSGLSEDNSCAVEGLLEAGPTELIIDSLVV